MSSVAGLNSEECGLTDGSAEGDWRLPTKDELQGIGTDPPTTWTSGYPSVTWTKPGSPFVNVPNYSYWSSTEYNTSYAWRVSMNGGFTAHDFSKLSNVYEWPVRSAN